MLKRVKGLVIITVLKVGFLFLGRVGFGVIVVRLKDGIWSVFFVIVMVGVGVGGMVGVELIDFVFILNSEEVVRFFFEFGIIILGGNVLVFVGFFGRSVEVVVFVFIGGVSVVFVYFKSKGLFVGVFVEGLVILERREVNRKFYGDNCILKMILLGRVKVLLVVDFLFRILELRAFNFIRYDYDDNVSGDDFYDDG